MFKNLEPIKGFEDIAGNEATLRGIICNNLEKKYLQNGYELIEFPMLEHQALYSTEFVGIHPWPGWHPRSLFALNTKDFNKAYEELPTNENNVFLIPEGTASVCRYIAKSLNSDPKSIDFPKKYFYITKCFRNELVSELKETKKREFTQIGIEYIGDGTIYSDISIFRLILDGLKSIGILKQDVTIRYSDVRLFNFLVAKDGLQLYEQNKLKTQLDSIASLRAKGINGEELTKALKSYETTLEELNISESSRHLWETLAAGYIRFHELSKKLEGFPQEIVSNLADLYTKSEPNIQKVLKIDLAVIRGQDYYNKTTFQVDLKTPQGVLSEVGGGGRYDHFIQKLLASETNEVQEIPATGMAYSLERLTSVLHKYLSEEDLCKMINGKSGIVLWGKDLARMAKIARKSRNVYDVVELVHFEDQVQAEEYARKKNFKFRAI